MTKLITFNYNYYDEELIDVFIAFLKSLALTLTPETLQYYLDSVSAIFANMALESKLFPAALGGNQIL